MIMIKRILKTTGETLIEAIISLTVIGFAGAAAASIVVTALSTTLLSENFLIAQNLAMEGVESVKNLRDTNYMKFPLYIDECWLALSDSCTASSPGAVMDSGNFILKYMALQKNWKLVKVIGSSDFLDLEEPTFDNQRYKLYLYTLLGTTYYSNTQTPPIGGETKFYRGINVISADANKIEIEVKVEWFEGAEARTFSTGPTTITNHQR